MLKKMLDSLQMCALAIALMSGSATAEEAAVTTLSDGRVGQIAFQSILIKWFADLATPAALPKVTVSGILAVPPSAGRVPAMVISHTAGGRGPHEAEWANRLNGQGIATFRIDSFTGPGISGTSSTVNDMVDALFALKLLATHPRIDPARIGVIGFSRGGNVALYTLLEPIRQSIIADNVRFAAHIAFYPGCTTFYYSNRVDRTPTLMLLGAADDETPAAPCQAVAAKLRARGASIKEIVYPGAGHAFDQNRPVTWTLTRNGKNCFAEQNVDTWQTTVPGTGAVVTAANLDQFLRGCLTSGSNEGMDPNARRQSIEAVQAFLKETLHP
jgi:dienelactone hydrolase